MSVYPLPANPPAIVAYDDGGPAERDIRPTALKLPALFAHLLNGLTELSPEDAAAIVDEQLAPIRKAANVVYDRLKVRRKRDAQAAGTWEPEDAGDDSVTAIRTLQLGQTRMRAYRTRLVEVCRVCAYCGRNLTENTATLDHVQPKCKKGTNHPSNLVLSCEPCNQAKGGDTPAEWAVRILKAVNDDRHFEEALDLIEQHRREEPDGDPYVVAFPVA